MRKILNLSLFLLFIDFVNCIIEEGTVIHVEEEKNEEIIRKFTVDGITLQEYSSREVEFKLLKAQGQEDNFSSQKSPKETLTSNPFNLAGKYKDAAGDRLKFDVDIPTVDKPRLKFTLTINPTKIEDSGSYSIEVRNVKDDKLIKLDAFSIFVHARPLNVHLYGGNSGGNLTDEIKQSDQVKFESYDDATGELICKGETYGYRKPNVAWNLKFDIDGNSDVFENFKVETTFTVSLEGDLIAMKKPKTLVTTKITGIKLSPNLSGKKLTCSMIDWKYSSLSKSQQKQITIRGKPDVYGPTDPIGGVLGKPGVIYAQVYSSPVVNTHTWTRGNRILEETNDLVKKANCKTENDYQKCNYTIEIKKVLPTHYGSYKLTAKNKYGSDSLDIKFLDEKDKSSASTGHCLIPSIMMLIATLTFTNL